MSKNLNNTNNVEENFLCFDDNGSEPEIIAKEKDGKQQWYKMYKEHFVSVDQTLKIYNFMQQNSLDYVTVKAQYQKAQILDDKDIIVSFGEKDVPLSEIEPYDNSKLRKALEKQIGDAEKFYRKQSKNNDAQATEDVATNKLANLRKKIAHNIDKTLGTNLEEKKLVKPLKKIEKFVSDKLFGKVNE